MGEYNVAMRLPLGLVNRGRNTCFLNAVLQSLASISSFQSFISARSHSGIAARVAELIESISRPVEPGSAYPEDASDLLDSQFFARHFILGQQHDAEELFSFLMDALRTDKQRKGMQQAKPFWCDEVVLKTPRRSPTTYGFGTKRPVNPFEGLEAHSICCDECGYVSSVRYSDFLNLNLFVPPVARTSLAACLEQYTQTELVEDYLCDGCAAEVTIRKRTLLGQLPRALCLHLQLAVGGLLKSTTAVDFPRVIDMAPYTVNAHAASFFGATVPSVPPVSSSPSPFRAPLIGGAEPFTGALASSA